MIYEDNSILGVDSGHDRSDKGLGADKLAQIIDFLPDAILAIDLEGKVIAWNRAMEVLTGAKAGEMLGRTDHEHALPFYGERRPILVDLALRSSPESEAEYSSLKREGTALVGEIFIPTFGQGGSYIWAKAVPLYDDAGNVIGAIESIRDITDRKREEKKAAGIIEFLPDATFVINTDGKVIAWNRALEEMTGVKAEEILGEGDYEYAVPFYGSRRPILVDLALKSNQELESKYSNLQRDCGSIVGEVFIPTFGKEGSYIWAKATPLYDDGNIIGAIESIRDITERKRTEVALHESEEHFRTMMEQSPISMAIFDTRGELVNANSASEAIFRQASCTPMTGRYSILEDDQLRMAGIPSHFKRALAGESVSVPDFEYVIHTKESCSKKRWLKARIYPLRDPGGKVLSVVAAFEDITERKRAEQKMTDIIDFLPDATFVRCLDGTVIAWNKAMEKLTGVKARDILGRGNYEYALPFYGERRPILVDLALRSSRELEAEYINLKREGSALVGEIFIPTFGQGGSFIWCKATPLFDSAGNITGAIESIRDITERKREEQKIAGIIEFLPDATLVIDKDGKAIAWNKAMEELTGAKAKNILGKGSYEYARPIYGIRRPLLADLALTPDVQFEKKYDSIQREGDALVAEVYLTTFRQEGAYMWAKATPLRDGAGNIIGAIESMRDITKRKLAEQALRRSEREKEAILSGLRNVAVEYLDDSMRIIWINEAVQKRLGLSMDQLRGKYCYEAVQGLDSPCPGCKVIGTLQTGKSQEGELITPDGRAWEAKSNPIRDDAGRVTGVVQVAMNITERKRAEQKMADIINFLPDATFVIDTDGKVIAWNRAMECLTGIQAKEMLGRGDCEYSLPIYGTRRRMLIDLVLRSDEILEGKYDTVQREGNTIITEVFVPSFKPGGAYLWTKASPLYDPGGKLIGAIETMRDVTEHRQIEQKLERSKAELQIAAEIQKNFLPDHTPSVFQFKLAAVTIPAMEVGGDFYDFISLPDGRQGLVIADVAGKSIPAALFMALSRTIVRANAAHQPQTAEVLREANNMIAEDASAGMFVTLFYGILDGKAHTLTYANAGHPPLLVFRTGGCRCTEQEVTGVALGAMDGMEYEERQVQFLPGDVAVLYTDGVTEAVNRKGEMYGLKRLCSVMTRNGHLSAQEIMEKVLDDISEFSGDQSQYDDITLVVLKAE